VVECFDDWSNRTVVLADHHRQRCLSGGGKEASCRQYSADLPGTPEACQTRDRQDHGVDLSASDEAYPSVDIPADLDDIQVGALPE
jgi:hypothetical protein